MRKRIYISGPITLGDLDHNLKQASEAFFALANAGYAPICPHLHCYLGGAPPSTDPGGLGHDVWMEIDYPFVAVSDAVLRLPGLSKGADLETACAREHRIPVYYGIDSLLAGMRP